MSVRCGAARGGVCIGGVIVAAVLAFAAPGALAAGNSSWSPRLGLPGLGFAPDAVAASGSQVYAGGSFTSIEGGVSGYNHIAKWTGTGWSPLTSGLNGRVYAVAVAGSTVYVGGSFTLAGSTTVSNLAKWTGSGWASVGGGTNNTVFALAYDNGTLYAGGDFTAVRGGAVAVNSVAAYKIAADTWSNLGGGVTNCTGCSAALVNALAWNPVLNQLFVTGTFANAGTTKVNSFASWNGSSWQGYGTGITYSNGAAHTGDALAVDPSSGAVYVGGQFAQAGGSPAANLARLSSGNWSSPGDVIYANNTAATVDSLAVVGSSLYVGGQFDTAGGVPADDLAAFGAAGWRQVGHGVNGVVWALAPSGSSSVVAAGQFTNAGPTSVSGDPLLDYVGRWNGSAWSTFGQGIVSGGSSGGAFALTPMGSGVTAGGSFSQAGAILAPSIERFTGSGWTRLASGLLQSNGTAGLVYSMTTIGSDLYVGGSFSKAGGTSVTNIAMWDGTGWHSLGPAGAGLDGPVFALTSIMGELYAGGSFGHAGSVATTEVARYDPASQKWSALGRNPSYGPTGAVEALANFGDRFLLIGGNFPSIGNTSNGQFAAADGFVDFDTTVTSFPQETSGYGFPGGTDGTIKAIQVMPGGPNGDVYVGGSFSHAGVAPSNGGIAVSNIADFETAVGGSGGLKWAALHGSGVNGQVNALAETTQTTAGAATTPVLYVGGNFTHAGAAAAAANIVSYTPSALTWSALGSGTSGPVLALAQNGQAGLFAAGQFLTAGAKPSAELALWTATSGLAP